MLSFANMLTIRATTVNDLSVLSQLWYEQRVLQLDRRVLPAVDARDQWAAAAKSWLHEPRCGLFSADNDGTLVGGIVGWLQPLPGLVPGQIGLITELVIDTHGYHGGAGRALVGTLRDWFAGQGAAQTAIWTLRADAVAQAFWRSMGATEWVDILWLKS